MVGYDGDESTAFSLRAVGALPGRPDLPPSARYLNIIQEGARQSGLTEEWRAKLDAIQPAPRAPWT